MARRSRRRAASSDRGKRTTWRGGIGEVAHEAGPEPEGTRVVRRPERRPVELARPLHVGDDRVGIGGQREDGRQAPAPGDPRCGEAAHVGHPQVEEIDPAVSEDAAQPPFGRDHGRPRADERRVLVPAERCSHDGVQVARRGDPRLRHLEPGEGLGSGPAADRRHGGHPGVGGEGVAQLDEEGGDPAGGPLAGVSQRPVELATEMHLADPEPTLRVARRARSTGHDARGRAGPGVRWQPRDHRPRRSLPAPGHRRRAGRRGRRSRPHGPRSSRRPRSPPSRRARGRSRRRARGFPRVEPGQRSVAAAASRCWTASATGPGAAWDQRASVRWASMPPNRPSSTRRASGSSSEPRGVRSARAHATWGASHPRASSRSRSGTSQASPGRPAIACAAVIAVGASVVSRVASTSSRRTASAAAPPWAAAAAAAAARGSLSGMASRTDDTRRVRSRMVRTTLVRVATRCGLAERGGRHATGASGGREAGRRDRAPGCGRAPGPCQVSVRAWRRTTSR